MALKAAGHMINICLPYIFFAGRARVCGLVSLQPSPHLDKVLAMHKMTVRVVVWPAFLSWTPAIATIFEVSLWVALLLDSADSETAFDVCQFN